MPKGVEHEPMTFPILRHARVRRPLMPKGVEHRLAIAAVMPLRL